MPRRNCNAQRIYRPTESWEGFPKKQLPERPMSSIKTTGESIVREFRLAGRGVRVEIPADRKPISGFERAVRIFLIAAIGWFLGYLHAWMAMK